MQTLGDKLAALEGAEAALPLASGMAAISTTLLALLGSGDHLLIQRAAYVRTVNDMYCLSTWLAAYRATGS